MVATALQPTAAPARKMPAREMNPAELYAKINRRIASLEVLQKRADVRALVAADLRERKPVIVVNGFKWEGEYIGPGEEFLPDEEFLPRVMHLLEQPQHNRLFTTKANAQALQKLKELRKLSAELAPLVSDVSKYRSQASQARASEAAARQMMEASRREASEAEKNLTRADGTLKDFMKQLDLDI